MNGAPKALLMSNDLLVHSMPPLGVLPLEGLVVSVVEFVKASRAQFLNGARWVVDALNDVLQQRFDDVVEHEADRNVLVSPLLKLLDPLLENAELVFFHADSLRGRFAPSTMIELPGAGNCTRQGGPL